MGASTTWEEAEGAGSVQPGEGKAQVGFINEYKCLMGGSKHNGPRLFSLVLTDSTRGDGDELKYQKIHLKNKSCLFGGGFLVVVLFCLVFFMVRWSNTGTGCAETSWSPYPWRYSSLDWTWDWATGSRWSCSEEGGRTRWLPEALSHFSGSFPPQRL